VPRTRIWVAVALAIGAAWFPGTKVSGAPDATPAVLRATLDNGLRAVIVRSRLAPVVTTELSYLVGASEAPPGFPGTAHAVEHMMFRGSPGLSADQLASIAAAMGGMFDATTQQTVSQYSFTVPVEDLDSALRIEATRMRGILAREDLWALERGAIEQEVSQDLSDPQYVAYTRILAALFAGTPYAHDGLGTRASFHRTSAAQLRRFHDAWYAPNNAILVIVGDIEPPAALARVKERFGDLRAKPLPPRPAVDLRPVVPRSIDLASDLPNGLVLVAVRMPGSNSADYAAGRVLAHALASPRAGLAELVAEGKALAADFGLDELPRAGLGYVTAAFPRGGDPAALLAEVRRILAETAARGVPADLVEAAKRREIARAEFRKNSIPGLAAAWSQAVAIEGRQTPDDDLRAIEQVTVEDVNRVAHTHLDLAQAVVAILRPQTSGMPVASSGRGGRESVALAPTRPVTLPRWAAESAERLPAPRSAVGPEVTMLPNGLRLIVQPAPASRTVRAYGRVRTNAALQVPDGKEGVDEVLDRLLAFGTTSLDRLAYQEALDRIAADVTAGTDFSLGVLSEHFERGMELLADNVLHPALPEAAFTIVRQQVAATVAGRLRSPDYLAGRALRVALLPKKDPMLRQATPATVASLTLEDVRRYFESVFRPDLTTIVVIGDVTPARAQTAIERYFGDWQAGGPRPEILLPAVPASRPSRTHVPDRSRLQDKVTLAETLGLTRSDPDYYALQLGNRILGGSFYSTRLYRDLREQTGLVYYVDSSFDVGRTRALYTVEYACDPPNVGKARAIVERNLRAMRTATVTPLELHRAKASALREIPLAESSLVSIATSLLALATRDLPLDEPTVAAHRYLELTADQIRAAFARWIEPGNLAQVTVGPAPR
jgi:zinc protease